MFFECSISTAIGSEKIKAGTKRVINAGKISFNAKLQKSIEIKKKNAVNINKTTAKVLRVVSFGFSVFFLVIFTLISIWIF